MTRARDSFTPMKHVAPSLPDRTDAWRAVQQRDRNYDGRFVYAVSSTRIFCRPSCSSRRPNRENVRFFGTAEQAEKAGYRACKRCKPTGKPTRDIDTALASAAAFLKAHATSPITLSALSREVGVSAFHLQREFKRAFGVSPREFQDANRRSALTTRLRKGDTVSRATYEAGFGSSSRVYERASTRLGMTPAAVRPGGLGERVHFGIVSSSLGRVLVGWTEKGVCSVSLGDDDGALKRAFRSDFPRADVREVGPAIHEWVAAIVKAIDGVVSNPNIPIDARGTAFQMRVWEALQAIPRGTTLSYQELAKKIGQPTATRAVARACATNKIAVVIPCHRVVGSDGGLSGYRWGLERKEALLEREGSRQPKTADRS